MVSSLIRGRYVICRATGRTEAEIIEDGAVFQRDGRIVEIGRYDALRQRHTPDEEVGSASHVVLPGLVNSHHHVGLTPLQLGSRDHALELWIATRLGTRQVDLYLDTLYSAFEMIESGVTTVQHLAGWFSGTEERIKDDIARILAAYRDIGMRVSFSAGLRDQNRLVYQDDSAFAATLPSEIGAALERHLSTVSHPLDMQLQLFEDLYQRYNGEERTRIQLAPINLHWCSDRALEAVRDQAEKYQVPIHMHLLETAYQKEYAARRASNTAVEHIHRLGLLGPRMTLGHGVWLNESDIELVAETGTHICHNASSNLRLRSGIAPVNAFEQRGIRVGIGLDEAGINDDRDMLQEMRLVLNLHREPGMDDRFPTSAQVLRMASEHGAHTTPFGTDLGTLEPGKAADIVLMSWEAIASPFLDLNYEVSVLDAVVQRAKSSGVDTVLVAGEPIYRDRQFTKVDKAAALAELAAAMKAPLSEEEQSRRSLAQDVLPYVRAFYDGYMDRSTHTPFYRLSSRA
jgi:cytosine/adenosine deaminase-related metal-dependent hydrolase